LGHRTQGRTARLQEDPPRRLSSSWCECRTTEHLSSRRVSLASASVRNGARDCRPPHVPGLHQLHHVPGRGSETRQRGSGEKRPHPQSRAAGAQGRRSSRGRPFPGLRNGLKASARTAAYGRLHSSVPPAISRQLTGSKIAGRYNHVTGPVGELVGAGWVSCGALVPGSAKGCASRL